MTATSTKVKKPTKEQLRRKVLELEAQLAHVYHVADKNLGAMGTEAFMGSGVLVQLTALGGREIIPPVVVKNGLSQATIDALRRDLVRSYENTVAFFPSGATR